MLKIDTCCNELNIKSITTIVKNGGVIIFPTDTIYGIGCDPYNSKAVERIYKIKKRQKNKLLPILVYSYNEISKLAIINKAEDKIIRKFFPGQITLILNIKDNKIKKMLKLDNKIAIRIPNNKCILKLLKECKLLVGTSANISGENSFIDPIECKKKIQRYDVFIDGGKGTINKGSTIIEVVNNKIIVIRDGEITRHELEKII